MQLAVALDLWAQQDETELPVVGLSVADMSVVEDVSNPEYTVTLTPASDLTVTVRFDTADETATGLDENRRPVDYLPENRTLTFESSQTQKKVRVYVLTDHVHEDDETFTVTLSEPSNATLGTATGTVTIVDDDPLGVTLSATRVTVQEGGSASYTAVLTSQPTADVTLDVGVPAMTDLNVSPTQLTFTPANWSSRQTIEVRAATDTDALADPQEELTHSVSGGDYGEVTVASVTVWIVEAADKVLDIADARDTEDTGFMDFEVTLAPNTNEQVTVDFTTENGTAIDGYDFLDPVRIDVASYPSSLTFSPGESTRTIQIRIVNNDHGEDEETFTVTLRDATNATIGRATATGTIVDDDVSLVTIEDASVVEQEGAVMQFPVQLSKTRYEPITVMYETADGSATAGADYTATSGTLTFGPGGRGRTISVPIIDDEIQERSRYANGVYFAQETFTITLSNPTDATIERGTATGTIYDDDSMSVHVAAADEQVTEGDAAVFTLTRHNRSGDYGELSVSLSITQEGSFLTDAVPSSATFVAEVTTVSLTVATEDDDLDEPNGSVTTTVVRNLNYVVETPTASVTILDNDDHEVSYGAASYTATEGGSAAEVEVSLSTAPEQQVVIPITTTNNDGATAADYSGVPSSLTFSSGQTAKTFTVTATDDTEDDDDESVTLGFGEDLPDGVTTGTTSTTKVALEDDDDPAVKVSYGAASYTATEGGSGAEVEVSLSADPERDVEIAITTTNNDGATAADYSGVPASLTFSSGQTAKTFTVTATDDTVDDDDESVTLGFGDSLPDGVTTGTTSTTQVALEDDDDPAVKVSYGASSYTATEGGSAAAVEVRLSADPEREVVIPITKTNNDGATAADYSGVPTSLTFSSGQTAKTFTVTATDDTADDDGESVTLGFGETLPDGVSAGTTSTTQVALEDDDDPAVKVSYGAASYTATEGGSGAEVEVSLSADPERDVEIAITKTNNDGATGADYSGVPASLTFSSGQTAQTFTVTATDDTADDDGESVTLGFGDTLPDRVTTGTTSTTKVALEDDDDPAVEVSYGASSYTATEGGSAAAVEVRLSADPERDVEIAITKTNNDGATAADYSGVPASLTFSSGQTAKTFTVTATDDTADDDGESVTLGFGNTLPDGVSAGTTSTTKVALEDDDDPAVKVSYGAASYTATEGGSAAEVEVRLSADPERDVEIAITKTNNDGATAADYSGVPASLTFSSGQTAKTFTVTATDDTADDDGESVTLGFGNTLPDGVSAGTTSTTKVALEDDDDPAVKVSYGAASYTATEGGSAAEVEVRLSADPERDVEIAITKTNNDGATAADYSGVPTSLTFSSGQTAQTFTVTATDDTADDDGESVTLGFGETLPDGITAGTTSTTKVALEDDDDPAVKVSYGAASYTATEGGSAAEVEVRLSVDPEREVVIPITKTNNDGATAADYSGVPASLTFSSGQTAKTFTVTATDDTVDDDGESVTLGFGNTLPAGVSTGTQSTTKVALVDNDDPAVKVNYGASSYTATEGGSAAAVEVRLSADPERDVEIAITKTNNDGATAADYSGVPASLTFSSGQTAKTFTVTATDDTVDDDGESVTLGFGETLPDGVSAGTTSTTKVALEDDDDPAVKVNYGASSYTATEGGSAAAVEVRLSVDPEREVVIPITKTNNDGATAADYSGVPTSLTFSSGQTAQTFTVTATDDSDEDDGESVTLGFGNTLPDGVTTGTTSTTKVALEDDDDPAVKVSYGAASYTATEGGSAAEVEVRLSVDPEREVVIPITKTNNDGATAADYSGVPASLTFSSGQTAKTFTVTATDDTVDDDGESVTLGFGETLPDGVSAGTTSTTKVALEDDDDPAVKVNYGAASYTATEGGSAAEVEVRLSVDPERDVEIAITKTNNDGATAADYSGVPASLTFSSGQTAQTFTVTATDDTADDDGESVTLGFGETLPDGVTTGTTSTTKVALEDDDDPAVKVSYGAASYTATEGGSAAEVEVRLSVDPEREVEIAITKTNNDGATAADYSGVPTSLTFSSGQTAQTFTVTATDDTADDDGESVTLGFGSTLPAGVSTGTQSTTKVALEDDDDPAVKVSYGAAGYTATEGGSAAAVEVILSADPERDVEVAITTTNNGGATAADYSGVPASLTFSSGETAKTFTVTAIDDAADDDDESVTLGFGSTLPADVSTGTQSTTKVTLEDDDDPAVKVSYGAAGYTATEAGLRRKWR